MSAFPKVGTFVKINFTNGAKYGVVHKHCTDGKTFEVRMLNRAARKGNDGWPFKEEDLYRPGFFKILPERPSADEVKAALDSR